MKVFRALLTTVILTAFLLGIEPAWAQSDTFQFTENSKFTFTFSSGVDFSGVQGGNSHVASPSFNYAISRNVFGNFHFSMGLDFSIYRTKSEPVYNFIIYDNIPNQAPIIRVDNFKSINRERYKFIGLPIKVSYFNSSSPFTPIMSLGIIPARCNWGVFYSHKEDDPEDISPVYLYREKGFRLFATAEIGAGYNHNNWRFSLLATSNFLIKQKSYITSKPYSIGLDASISRRINASPFQAGPSNRFNSSSKKKKNALFIEALGSGFFYSINYQRFLILNDKVTYNARLGLTLHYANTNNSTYSDRSHQASLVPRIQRLYSDGSRFLLPRFIPVSMGVAFGTTHKLELGLGYTISPVSDDEWIFSEIGYRLETKNNYLLRITATPLYFIGDRIIPWGGISVGRKF